MNDWVDAEEELTKELCFRGTEMTNDRELLELAAKAAGYKHTQWAPLLHPKVDWGVCTVDGIWNPLTDDGHALRLAVKLGINLMHSKHKVKAGRKLIEDGPCEEDKRPDPYAATRRAVVRAAAEIGRTV